MWSSGRRKAPLWHALGAVYVGIPALALVLLRKMPSGAHLVLGVFIAVLPFALGRLLVGLQELINLGLAIMWIFLMYKAYSGERYRIPQLADLADTFSKP